MFFILLFVSFLPLDMATAPTPTPRDAFYSPDEPKQELPTTRPRRTPRHLKGF